MLMVLCRDVEAECDFIGRAKSERVNDAYIKTYNKESQSRFDRDNETRY